MAESCVLYYITDRHQFSADEYASRKHLLAKIREAACAGVDYIQMREKDLRTCELETLSRDAVKVLDGLRPEIKYLFYKKFFLFVCASVARRRRASAL